MHRLTFKIDNWLHSANIFTNFFASYTRVAERQCCALCIKYNWLERLLLELHFATLRIIIINSCYGQSLLYYVEYKYSFMKYKFRIKADENIYHAYDLPDSIVRDQMLTSSALHIIQLQSNFRKISHLIVFAQLYNLYLFQI